MNMQPTELTAEQLDNIRVRARVEGNATFTALLAHADALAAKVARLDGESRRRRVSEELPPRHAPIVVGFDNGFTWVYDWDGNRRFDWWAPIPKGAAHVAHD